ncbi:Hypothetical predicted protein [Xyrichtys novacula]|uniref:Uncharacterized protein n=1 Tax=Xyrichtys novacula TaxID=13765 RepID=A0AAV1H9R5_XYRNO|nr:Hypothetical predicted protein [Xyrichtys novacula]
MNPPTTTTTTIASSSTTTTTTTTTTITAAPPTGILSRYLRKVLRGTRVRGIGWGGCVRGGGGGRKGERQREGEREKEIIWALHQRFSPSTSSSSSSCSCPSWSPEGPGRRPYASQPCNLFITLIC